MTLLHNPIDGRIYTTDYSGASVSILLDSGTGIAEAQKSRTAHGAAPTIVSRAQLMARLQHDPSLSLFDATGRAIINLQSGVVFLLSPAGPHRLVVAE